MGAYLLSTGLVGLMQLNIPGGVSGWFFFGLFLFVALLGAFVQVFIVRPWRQYDKSVGSDHVPSAPAQEPGTNKAADMKAPMVKAYTTSSSAPQVHRIDTPPIAG